MKEKKLMKNTAMLYILSFSNYFFGLVTIPYLTRVLGAATYGIVGIGQAFAIYVQLFLDFGFILSATAEIAKVRDDKAATEKVFSTVILAKLVLVFISFAVVWILCCFVPMFRNYPKLFYLFWLYMAVNSLLPDFLYRGLERMEIITLRTLVLKGVFAICIYFFIKNEAQYYLVPLFYLFGSLASVCTIYYHLNKKLQIHFIRVNWADVHGVLKSSWLFFASRIATTVFSALNTLILGSLYGGTAILGLYTASEKLVSAGKGAITPISDSLYPHMVKTADYALAKRILIVSEIVLLLGCVVVFAFSYSICAIAFGEEYREAGSILRYMLPMILIALPNYMIAFPILTPLGMVKYANSSNIIGSIIHCVGLAALYLTKNINIYSVCVLTIVTEGIILLIRIWAMRQGFQLTKQVK